MLLLKKRGILLGVDSVSILFSHCSFVKNRSPFPQSFIGGFLERSGSLERMAKLSLELGRAFAEEEGHFEDVGLDKRTVMHMGEQAKARFLEARRLRGTEEHEGSICWHDMRRRIRSNDEVAQSSACLEQTSCICPVRGNWGTLMNTLNRCQT